MLSLEDINQYVEENIGEFHQKRLVSLSRLKLRDILLRKNPYMFRAKNVLTSEVLVKTMLDAHLSSQEETIFGEFLEGLAVFVCSKIYNGYKSSAEGVDLEFENSDTHYFVTIKSGPNWGSSSSIARMRDNFKKAMRIRQTNTKGIKTVAVNGCCYGRDNSPDKGDYLKYCGQKFWSFVTGDDNFYIKIVEPLGYKAKEKNEEFVQSYSQLVNKFTSEFSGDFCDGGMIDWEKLVRMNSSANVAEKNTEDVKLSSESRVAIEAAE